MDIQDKTVLVIGGWGLVGSAICSRIMEEHPGRVIVTSLRKEEALDAVRSLQKEYPRKPKSLFVPWWGNIFVRESLKDLSREDILNNPRNRQHMLDDVLSDLTPRVLKRFSLYRLILRYRPDVVVDCVNTATGIAYQDIFAAARDTSRKVARVRSNRTPQRRKDLTDLLDTTERLIATLYVPQLIRHVQVMYRAMSDAGTAVYVKIGTSGTGGMGLNIPYTHSEERPSRVLLSKSAVAGAHTLLLFLMARTPDAPITKEIKPTAAIAWKRIQFGDVRKGGKAVPLTDCPPDRAVRLKRQLSIAPLPVPAGNRGILRSVFIDTGENGIFSRGEFEAISTPGQMEFVTPEEIAESAVFEIMAGNTGHDVINALDNATLAPTYRAGFMLNGALARMQQLEKEHGVDSVAFEMLGPPRLSKLLYEAYLLKLAFSGFSEVGRTSARAISARLTQLIDQSPDLRSRIISIGIPILLPDGTSLLRGPSMKIPPFRGESVLAVTPASIDRWAHDGWVDLRTKNMTLWKKRLKQIMRMTAIGTAADTSSRKMYNREYWNEFRVIEPGKVCGWIFTYEEKGKRMKA
jgi:NAD(P)-dependent dehydrogenase (short-subunit alcohol dehydrogenase family)